jgi:hypothetical protein
MPIFQLVPTLTAEPESIGKNCIKFLLKHVHGGLLGFDVMWTCTNDLEEHDASILRAEDGGSMFYKIYL